MFAVCSLSKFLRHVLMTMPVTWKWFSSGLRVTIKFLSVRSKLDDTVVGLASPAGVFDRMQVISMRAISLPEHLGSRKALLSITQPQGCIALAHPATQSPASRLLNFPEIPGFSFPLDWVDAARSSLTKSCSPLLSFQIPKWYLKCKGERNNNLEAD